MEGNMKENGKRTCEMEGVSKGTQMVTLITDNSKLVKLMERECISGKMEKYMMGNGARDLKKAMEFGEVYMVILI